MNPINLVYWPNAKTANTVLATGFIPERIAYASGLLLQQKENDNAR